MLDASESGITWRKSRYSGANSNCVEAGSYGPKTAVRDSKAPWGPALTFPAGTWTAFTSALKGGRLS
ncbi:DUF397 domain-containing protein [Streptomyces sp. SB3404]|uniref:DUF397 domain-containing protein n=1 Tax=Streptomyces boncukensis TaxID=2711219 RepID=A0A6G4X1Z1_9ACTN|nr:DUF397 domain-containing protein [Streptomyces boncukensis]NGO70900.1 DUF397 domain-containing protein [Streptomyces boncukensis]